MSVAKSEAVKLIETLPDDCTYEDIHYHLYVRQKVEHGILAIESGDVVSQAEAEREVQRWLMSSGPDRP